MYPYNFTLKAPETKTEPGCSKLRISLVNVSLKFQTLKFSNIFVEKASLILSTKHCSVFGNRVVKHLTSWPFNELVKLRML